MWGRSDALSRPVGRSVINGGGGPTLGKSEPSDLMDGSDRPPTSEQNDAEGGDGSLVSWCARAVTTAKRLLLRQLAGALEGGAKPCYSVGGLARRARKWR
uniref:Uncharacterized protein n=1 Tax=Oryza sativa subsp. japonica TaxID=39947 RepID=Q84MP3_ORYSJ|nr:hypothetical protein [Oryza sativa Japonica Group]